MKKILSYVGKHRRQFILLAACTIAVLGLLLYRLGTLTPGVSPTEQQQATAAVGWHGIYHHPLYLPLLLLRSVVFFIFPTHGALLARLPNALIAAIAAVAFAVVVRSWHGVRTAWLAGLLFICSAWFLHVGRLASYDILYLAAIPFLLAVRLISQKYRSPICLFGLCLTYGLLLYVPGLVWLLAVDALLNRNTYRQLWRDTKKTAHKILLACSGVFITVPLILDVIWRQPDLRIWLGLPATWPHLTTLVKQFLAVPIHLFLRGPQYPEVWLGRLPILDLFTLVLAVLGGYFYVTHWQAARSRAFLAYLLAGGVLVGLGGAVGLSLLVPILYLLAATGLTYLLHEWLKVFPINPFARGFGVALICLAVAMSCIYNLRAYYVAWPHNSVTKATFHIQLKD